jgi:2-polyprenyl-3-methyl-5-hydroxy-6-metoxy-1,4-benzoquinol methylase
MVNLLYRSDKKEYIDNPCMDAQLLSQTYQELKIINICTLGYWPTMSAVKYFLGRYGRKREIRILDIGCGDGEILRRIKDYGNKRNFSLDLTGIDLNQDVITVASQRSPSGIRFIHGDIFADRENKTYDIIINSLTMHHLTDQEIVKLMRWMTNHARIGWSISDLHRRSFAYYFAMCFVRLAGLNHVICHDAPLSVARGFRRRDWIDLLSHAELNINSTQLSWYPNFRYGIRYEKFL